MVSSKIGWRCQKRLQYRLQLRQARPGVFQRVQLGQLMDAATLGRSKTG